MKISEIVKSKMIKDYAKFSFISGLGWLYVLFDKETLQYKTGHFKSEKDINTDKNIIIEKLENWLTK